MAALSLTPGQTTGLDLTNVRTAYCLLGPTRPDNKLIPGDTFLVAFDIQNAKETDDGEVFYGMAMEVLDSKNKTQFKQDLTDNLRALNSLGGRRLPAYAHVDLGLDQPPGKYTLKVTVNDRGTKTMKSFTREFEVLPPTFGLVRFNLTSDVEGRIAAPFVGVAGQTVWINFHAVGFKRGGQKDEPNLSVEMRVMDEADKPTLPKPFLGEVKELPKDLRGAPLQFVLTLNRPGKFTIKLKATDKLGKKTAELSFPITVLESK
jgi:hypothetical protein